MTSQGKALSSPFPRLRFSPGTSPPPRLISTPLVCTPGSSQALGEATGSAGGRGQLLVASSCCSFLLTCLQLFSFLFCLLWHNFLHGLQSLRVSLSSRGSPIAIVPWSVPVVVWVARGHCPSGMYLLQHGAPLSKSASCLVPKNIPFHMPPPVYSCVCPHMATPMSPFVCAPVPPVLPFFFCKFEHRYHMPL